MFEDFVAKQTKLIRRREAETLEKRVLIEEGEQEGNGDIQKSWEA